MEENIESGGDKNLEKLKEKLKYEEVELDKRYKAMSIMRNEADSANAITKSNKLTILYNIFSSLLLIISYILFGIASTVFINTCININKANIEEIETSELINQPIFEYLKPINNLSIDRFLLYFDGTNSPFVWVIMSIIIISLIIVALIILYWSQYDTKNFNILYEDLLGNFDKKRSFIIKVLPYIIITLIIYPFFNNNQKIFDLRLTDGAADKIGSYNSDFEKNIGINNGKYKNLFKKLKNIIIHWININEHYDTTKNDLDTNIIKLLVGKNIEHYNEIKDKFTIFEEILIIYYKEYNGKTMKKEEKIKFITFIDEYFNILINIKSTDTNYYARYYLLGLITESNKPTDSKNNRIYYLRNFKTMLRTELIAIKNDIKGYYITVLVFYGLFLIIILFLYFPFIFNTITELLFMYKITYIGIMTSLFIIILVNYGIFSPKV